MHQSRVRRILLNAPLAWVFAMTVGGLGHVSVGLLAKRRIQLADLSGAELPFDVEVMRNGMPVLSFLGGFVIGLAAYQFYKRVGSTRKTDTPDGADPHKMNFRLIGKALFVWICGMSLVLLYVLLMVGCRNVAAICTVNAGFVLPIAVSVYKGSPVLTPESQVPARFQKVLRLLQAPAAIIFYSMGLYYLGHAMKFLHLAYPIFSH